ncbi:MAG: DUF1573 domain-containing protein [Cyclobacteriaceae bacterium]
MKRHFIQLVAVMFVGAVLFSCSNKEAESKIARLEGKIAELEAKQGGSKPAATANVPEVKPEGPLPEMQFEVEDHDFGTINEGDIVEKLFKFKNVGDAPLIISSATASCGCTVPVWPKEPIAVGEEGEIQVRFNSKSKPGVQNKTVTITANTYPKINRVRIKANVNKSETQNPA